MNNGPHASRRGAGQPAVADPDLIAIQALTFLGEDPGRAERFFAVSGLSVGSLRQAARDPVFLKGVLDYIVSDELLLLAFAESRLLDPESIVRCRDARRPS